MSLSNVLLTTLFCASLIACPKELHADETGQFVVPFNNGKRLTGMDALILKQKFGTGATDSIGQELGGSDGILLQMPKAQFGQDLKGVTPGTSQSGLDACLSQRNAGTAVPDRVSICNSAPTPLNLTVSVDGNYTVLTVNNAEVKSIDVTGAKSIVGSILTLGVDNSFNLKSGQFYILQAQGGKWVIAN